MISRRAEAEAASARPRVLRMILRVDSHHISTGRGGRVIIRPLDAEIRRSSCALAEYDAGA